VKSRRGLDEVGAGRLGNAARGDDRRVVEGGGLDDHLEHAWNRHSCANRVDVSLHRGPPPGARRADVDHHVHLVSAGGHRTRSLPRLDRAGVLAGGESAHRRHNQTGTLDGEHGG